MAKTSSPARSNELIWNGALPPAGKNLFRRQWSGHFCRRKFSGKSSNATRPPNPRETGRRSTRRRLRKAVVSTLHSSRSQRNAAVKLISCLPQIFTSSATARRLRIFAFETRPVVRMRMGENRLLKISARGLIEPLPLTTTRKWIFRQPALEPQLAEIFRRPFPKCSVKFRPSARRTSPRPPWRGVHKDVPGRVRC